MGNIWATIGLRPLGSFEYALVKAFDHFIIFMTEDIEDYTLSRQNLIPFYLVEDRIRDNFTKVEKFITKQQASNQKVHSAITELKLYNGKHSQQMSKRLLQFETKIVREITSELEGRILVAINKNMGAFASRIEEKEKNISSVTEGIDDKLEVMKKNIVYEISQENLKSFTKETQKLEKKLKADINDLSKKTEKARVNSGLRPQSRQRQSREKDYNGRSPVSINYQSVTGLPQHQFSEDWALKIKQMENKINKFEQFAISFDKRFYQSMASLKDSWKEIGEDILETKRRLTSKQDELKLELIKIRGIKEFQGAPDDLEETFKGRLMQKFNDIYQLVSNFITKEDLNSEFQKTKKTTARHENQLSDIRQQLARNSQYFTFYVNNSNQDDLSARIKELKEEIEQKDATYHERFKHQVEKNQAIRGQFYTINEEVSKNVHSNIKLEAELTRLKEENYKSIERIDILQGHNKFGPEKMAKIHNTLDIDFTPSEQELIAKKNNSNNQNVAFREIKSELGKVKDQMFVLNHELAEMQKVKKSMTALESKMEKFKLESDDALLSRKPWVCLSCDKNQKEKQEGERLRKQVSKKKLSENRGGLFTQNRGGLFTKQKNEKLIKLLPSTEEKFEVYEKYRQKYLSDSVKLPDLYKQKFGDKEP